MGQRNNSRDRRASHAKTLILCGFAGLFDGNVVVFLRKLKWISYRGSGDGVTPCEFNMWLLWVLLRCLYTLAKPILFDKRDTPGQKQRARS